MSYFLIGFGVGSFAAAVINWKYKAGPRWINTKILVAFGIIACGTGIGLMI